MSLKLVSLFIVIFLLMVWSQAGLAFKHHWEGLDNAVKGDEYDNLRQILTDIGPVETTVVISKALEATNELKEKKEKKRTGKKKSIPIVILDAEVASEMVPIRVPFPLPQGALKELSRVSVVDEETHRIACQTKVLHRWGDGSVKWGEAVFVGNPKKEYVLTYGTKTEPVFPGQSVRAEKLGDVIVVETGAIRVSLPTNSGGLGTVECLRNKKITRLVNYTQDQWYLTRSDGKTFYADLDNECEVKLEENGPVQAVIAKTGWYVATDGERLGRHVTRYFFHAGRKTIFIRHRLIITAEAEEVGPELQHSASPNNTTSIRNRSRVLYRGFGLSLDTTLNGDRSATFDISPQADGVFFTTSYCGRGNLRMNQQAVYHHGAGENHWRIELDDKELATGSLCGDWAAICDASHRLALGVRRLWQQFPKEIAFHGTRATLKLWSDSGGIPMDMRHETRMKLCSQYDFKSSAIDLDKKMNLFEYGRGQIPSTVGYCKTHEILLTFEPATRDLSRVEQRFKRFSEKVYAVPDSEWTCGTGVFPGLEGPKGYPHLARAIAGAFDFMMRIARPWGDYGMFDYGAQPHMVYINTERKEQPRFVASWYRYSSEPYGFPFHPLLLSFWDPRRAYIEVAENYNTHHFDSGFIHYTRPGDDEEQSLAMYNRRRIRGCMSQRGNVGETISYWGVGSTPSYRFYPTVDALIHYYFLMGDEYIRDLIHANKNCWLKYAESRVKIFETFAYDQRAPACSLQEVALLFDFTKDERLLSLGERILSYVGDPDTHTGLARDTHLYVADKAEGDIYCCFKAWCLLRYYRTTGSTRAKEAFLKLANYIYKMGARWEVERNHLSEVYFAAYQMTNDRRFLYRIHQCVDRVCRTGEFDPGGAWTLKKFACQFGFNAVQFHPLWEPEQLRTCVYEEASRITLLCYQHHYFCCLPYAVAALEALESGQERIPTWDVARIEPQGLPTGEEAQLIKDFVGPLEVEVRTGGVLPWGSGEDVIITDRDGNPRDQWLTETFSSLFQRMHYQHFSKCYFHRIVVPVHYTGPLRIRPRENVWMEVRTYHPIRQVSVRELPKARYVRPHEQFVAGFDDAPENKALNVDNTQSIVMPTDKLEYLSPDEGTLEFWFQPHYNSSPRQERIQLVNDPYFRLYFDGNRGWIVVKLPGSGGRQVSQYIFTPYATGEWHHLILVWKKVYSLTDIAGNTVHYSEPVLYYGVYVDGKLLTTSDTKYPPRFNPEWEPKKTMLFYAEPSAVNYGMAFDEVRLSRVVRYEGKEVAVPHQPFAFDEQTIMHFHFDGSLKGKALACGAPIHEAVGIEVGIREN